MGKKLEGKALYEEFCDTYPTKKEQTAALKKMSNNQIQELMDSSGSDEFRKVCRFFFKAEDGVTFLLEKKSKSRKYMKWQNQFSSKEEKEKALIQMSVEEIEELIDWCPNVQCRIYLSKFRDKHAA